MKAKVLKLPRKMNSTEKEITYQSTNSYSTLNTFTERTKNVWFVCHGMGYLSRYFINYFKGLDPDDNYIIAPQAPSKYYQGKDFKHVGANWLTKDDTELGIENILNYFDAIFKAENITAQTNLIVFGYSQGVSVAMRYVAKRQIQCSQLVLHSGGIPKELTAEDFAYLNEIPAEVHLKRSRKAEMTVKLIYGTKDEYLNDERMASEYQRAQELFGKRLDILPFNGKHVVNVDIINDLV